MRQKFGYFRAYNTVACVKSEQHEIRLSFEWDKSIDVALLCVPINFIIENLNEIQIKVKMIH